MSNRRVLLILASLVVLVVGAPSAIMGGVLLATVVGLIFFPA